MEIKNLAKQYIYWPEVDNKYQKNMDISQNKLSDIQDTLYHYAQQDKAPVSDNIIRFYSLNEVLAKKRQQENDVLGSESIQLYNDYLQEIDELSRKMFSYIFIICMMEARHCLDYTQADSAKNRAENRYENSWHDYSYEEIKTMSENAKQNVIDRNMQAYEYKLEKEEYKKFLIYHKLVEEISALSGYSRNGIQDKLLPLFDSTDDETGYGNLNIKETLEFLSLMFENDNFESGYGGQAWAGIAQHALSFATGQINAEVFVDQAFSLEHNGGQIFNKNVIFTEADCNYWGMVTSTTPGKKSFNININQFLLNAQHQGQLLSLFRNTYDSEIINKSHLNQEKLTKLGVVDENAHIDFIENSSSSIVNNINLLHEIKDDFTERNPNFFRKLYKNKVDIPTFDLKSIIHNAKDYNGDLIQLSDKYNHFFNTFNYSVQLSSKNFPKNISQTTRVNTNKHYTFDYLNTNNIPEEKKNKDTLGNKAYNLALMQDIGLPVPRAMVFPATNSYSFFKYKKQWNKELIPALENVQKYFVDKDNKPVLCSVRSGSAVSMPGMMDTILNVGIDDSNFNYFSNKLGLKVTRECATKFMHLFSKSLLNEDIDFSANFDKALFQFRQVLDKHNIKQDFNKTFPLPASEQYKWCLNAVFQSWHSERATAYRNHQGVSHNIGTAAIVQEMVFGNLNDKSCTGVAFSRDCISGNKGIIGEFLVKAQGEDVVSGAVTPTNIKEMQNIFPDAYKQLVNICETLENDTGDIQDIEFTVENNKLYILQKRKAVCSSIAQIRLNQELLELGMLSEESLIKSIKVENLLPHDTIDTNGHKPVTTGLIANTGVMRGIVVHSEEDMMRYADLYQEHKNEKNFGWIFYAPLTSPDHAPIMIKTQAFITGNGGFTSHAAILARSWKKPCVVGIGEENAHHLNAGSVVTLDATNGKIYDCMLPIAQDDSNSIEHMVNKLLSHYDINLPKLEKNNPFTKVVDKINTHQTWMEKLPHCQVAVEEKTMATTQFLSLGEKVALILAKAQHDSAYDIKRSKKLKREKI